jgi:hypothetical protein
MYKILLFNKDNLFAQGKSFMKTQKTPENISRGVIVFGLILLYSARVFKLTCEVYMCVCVCVCV